MIGGSVTKEGDYAVIRLPLSEVHGLRVALEECPCKAPKSDGTKNVRQILKQALGRIDYRVS